MKWLSIRPSVCPSAVASSRFAAEHPMAGTYRSAANAGSVMDEAEHRLVVVVILQAGFITASQVTCGLLECCCTQCSMDSFLSMTIRHMSSSARSRPSNILYQSKSVITWMLNLLGNTVTESEWKVPIFKYTINLVWFLICEVVFLPQFVYTADLLLGMILQLILIHS